MWFGVQIIIIHAKMQEEIICSCCYQCLVDHVRYQTGIRLNRKGQIVVISRSISRSFFAIVLWVNPGYKSLINPSLSLSGAWVCYVDKPERLNMPTTWILFHVEQIFERLSKSKNHYSPGTVSPHMVTNGRLALKISLYHSVNCSKNGNWIEQI